MPGFNWYFCSDHFRGLHAWLMLAVSWPLKNVLFQTCDDTCGCLYPYQPQEQSAWLQQLTAYDLVNHTQC